MIGVLSALYSFLHYPLMPPIPASEAKTIYALILCGWIGSLLCGIASYRYAIFLALVPPAFLVWSKCVAWQVTGLTHAHIIDVVPLPGSSLLYRHRLGNISGLYRLIRAIVSG